MEFKYPDPDIPKNRETPDAVGIPSDPDGDFIIRDPQYGDHVVYSIEFPMVPRSSLRPALETGDESKLREHIQPQEDPGWFRLVNIVGNAVIRPNKGTSEPGTTVTVKVRDYKETLPYREPKR